MRTLYSIDNNLEKAHQLYLLKNKSKDNIKIAAYPKHIDYLKSFSINLNAYYNHKKELESYVKSYEPDLVLIDKEPILSSLSKEIGIPALHLSSEYILNEFKLKKTHRYYKYLMEAEAQNKQFIKLEPGLILSPLASYFNESQNEFINPYYDIIENNEITNSILLLIEDSRLDKIYSLISNIGFKITISNFTDIDYKKKLAEAEWVFTSGNIKYITDALYNNKKIALVPNVSNSENIIQATILEELNLGVDLGQIDLLDESILPKLEHQIGTFSPNKFNQPDNVLFLHEKIDQIYS